MDQIFLKLLALILILFAFLYQQNKWDDSERAFFKWLKKRLEDQELKKFQNEEALKNYLFFNLMENWKVIYWRKKSKSMNIKNFESFIEKTSQFLIKEKKVEFEK